MTTGAEHPAGWWRLCRRRALTAVAALWVIAVPISAHTSTLVAGVAVGPDLNVSVVSAVSTPRHDAGAADHVVTFLIANPDSRPATVTSTSIGFGDGVAGAAIDIDDPRSPDLKVGCPTTFGDVPPQPTRLPNGFSIVMVDCGPFELAGHSSTTAVDRFGRM